MQTKACSKCGEVKESALFFSEKRAADGLRSQCKGCCKAGMSRYYANNREKVLAQGKEYREENRPAVVARAAKYRSENAEAVSAGKKDWYGRNKGRVAAKVKAYRGNRPEWLAETMQAYRSANAEKLRADAVAYYYANREAYAAKRRHRIENDPAARLHEAIRWYVWRSLGGAKGGRRTGDIVGWSPQELADHIERQFVKGMGWHNRRQWHIDHIIPLSSFAFTGPDDPEVQRAWALPNLRPIWARDNLRKRDKRTHLL